MDVGRPGKMQTPELFHEPGLADLPRALHEQRFSARRILPLQQFFQCFSLHEAPRDFAFLINIAHNGLEIKSFLKDKTHFTGDFSAYHAHFKGDFLAYLPHFPEDFLMDRPHFPGDFSGKGG